MADSDDTSPERILSLEERVEALVTRVDALLSHLEGSGSALLIPSSTQVGAPSPVSRSTMGPGEEKQPLAQALPEEAYACLAPDPEQLSGAQVRAASLSPAPAAPQAASPLPATALPTTPPIQAGLPHVPAAQPPRVPQSSVRAPIAQQAPIPAQTQAPVPPTPPQAAVPATPPQAQAPRLMTAPIHTPTAPQSPAARQRHEPPRQNGQVPPAAKGTMMPSMNEANSSRFIVLVLSGLAALLVILAGTSLIALLWDSIPNWVKVLTLGLVAIAMTASGALWHKREAHPSIPPATLTGIGTGLGYLTGIGAALLDVLPPIGAFLVLLIWTIATTALATLSKMPFTLIATAIGGVLTLSLLYSHALGHPSQALLIEGLILAYSAACLVSSTVASRPLHGPVKRWTIASSTAVTVPALLFAPIEAASTQSSLGVYIMGTALAVLALTNLALLVCDPEQREWQWVWMFTPLIVIISCLSLTSIAAREEERLLLDLIHFLLCLGLIGFAATPKLSGPFKGIAEHG